MGANLVHSERRTEMTNLTVAFDNLAKAPKNHTVYLYGLFYYYYPPITIFVSQNVPFLLISLQEFCLHFSSLHTSHINKTGTENSQTRVDFGSPRMK
jgi:hypothetical protein